MCDAHTMETTDIIASALLPGVQVWRRCASCGAVEHEDRPRRTER